MPYVLRGVDGQITALLAVPQPGHEPEWLDTSSSEVQRFLAAGAPDGGEFSQLDQDFIRVIEDLVDLLIHKNLIRMTDLPVEAQRKLLSRKGARERLRGGGAGLLDDTELF